jgi:ribosome biogenesis protein MAK21
MSKQAKKGKGPQRSHGPKFDESALTQLTSKLERNLSATDNKRKKPPTNDAGSLKNQKRQRSSENGSAKKLSTTVDDGALLAEIKALGGDEEDLKLIADVDSSDDEYGRDDKPPMDKKLKDEVAALSKQLGLADHEPSEASDAEQDGAQPQQEDEDDEEDEEDEEDQVDEKMRRKAGNLV